MTSKERELWLRAQRRAAEASPLIMHAILRAFAALRDSISESEFARFIESGDVEGFIREALSGVAVARVFLTVRERLRQSVESNVKYFARDLPKAGKVYGKIAIEFNVLNPRVIDGIKTLDTKVIQTLADDERARVRQAVQQGLIDGKHPRTIARELKGSVGLSPKQEVNAQKYEAKLREDAKLTAKQVDKRIAAYRKAAITNNAETVSRTAALDAMKLGQKLAWDDAIEKGIVDRNKLTKTWKGVMDERERPTHVAMQNQTVPFDSPYSNGQMIPGDTEYNCRCISVYRVA